MTSVQCKCKDELPLTILGQIDPFKIFTLSTEDVFNLTKWFFAFYMLQQLYTLMSSSDVRVSWMSVCTNTHTDTHADWKHVITALQSRHRWDICSLVSCFSLSVAWTPAHLHHVMEHANRWLIYKSLHLQLSNGNMSKMYSARVLELTLADCETSSEPTTDRPP